MKTTRSVATVQTTRKGDTPENMNKNETEELTRFQESEHQAFTRDRTITLACNGISNNISANGNKSRTTMSISHPSTRNSCYMGEDAAQQRYHE